MLSLVPPSEAECAATRKRVMAEVVRQSRKRKADREQAAVQDEVTALFRRVMCEAAIIQCLVQWLDFRTLVTLVAFTDHNLRLRYATHNPGGCMEIETNKSGVDDIIRVQSEHTARIALERRVFEWPKRIQAHMRTKKMYQEPHAWINALRLYLNDVAGAKWAPLRSVIFKCMYCSSDDGGGGDLFFGVSVASLVNKKLSPLNCCETCYKERYPTYSYVNEHTYVHDNHITPTESEEHIRYFIQKKVTSALANDHAFLDTFDARSSYDIGQFCERHWDYVLTQWPRLAVYSDETLVNCLYERMTYSRQRVIVIRTDVLENVCALIVYVTKVLLREIGYTILRETQITTCFAWTKRHIRYAQEHSAFGDLFERNADGDFVYTPGNVPVIRGSRFLGEAAEEDSGPDAKKPKHNSDE